MPPDRAAARPATAALAALGLAALAASLWPRAALADSLRCGGGLVSVGDAKLDLLGKCGRPALVERRAVERMGALVERAPRVLSSQVAEASAERWTYNFGARRFVSSVSVEGGRVTAIDSGGYGYGPVGGGEPADIPRARCDYLTINEGDRAFDLLTRCGEPATRDVTVVTRRAVVWERGAVGRQGERRRDDAPVLLEGAAVSFTVELWAYDFGPRVFARLVELEDGVVTRVETASWGYSQVGSR